MSEQKIIILLSTYNGEEYLEEQLLSIKNQSYNNLKVIVRDDGSSDGTIRILEQWEHKYPNWITWYAGENIGYIKSFLELLYNAPDVAYYAFCDQDDIWLKDKVEVAINYLKQSENVPSIYTSNVTYCDKNLRIEGESKFYKNTTLWSALLYNQAVGCTMVFNKKLKQEMLRVPLENIKLSNVNSHDCWVYRLCLAAGGISYFDETSHILYRQHGNNQVGGTSKGINIWISRLRRIMRKDRNAKLEIAKEIYMCYSEFLPEESVRTLNEFSNYNVKLKNRIALVKNKEIYKGNILVDGCLFLSIMVGVI